MYNILKDCWNAAIRSAVPVEVFKGQVWMRVDFAEAALISIYLGGISKVDCFYDT